MPHLDGRERGLLEAQDEGEEDDKALREVRGEVVQEELRQGRGGRAGVGAGRRKSPHAVSSLLSPPPPSPLTLRRLSHTRRPSLLSPPPPSPLTLRRLSHTRRPSHTACTIVAKLSSARTILAASLDTSVPVMP